MQALLSGLHSVHTRCCWSHGHSRESTSRPPYFDYCRDALGLHDDGSSVIEGCVRPHLTGRNTPTESSYTTPITRTMRIWYRASQRRDATLALIEIDGPFVPAFAWPDIWRTLDKFISP